MDSQFRPGGGLRAWAALPFLPTVPHQGHSGGSWGRQLCSQGRLLVMIFQSQCRAKCLTPTLRWLIYKPEEVGIPLSKMLSHPSPYLSVPTAYAGRVYCPHFPNKETGWEELGDMLKAAHPAARRVKTDPLVQPTLLFLPQDTGRQVFPDPPLQMAPTSSREHCAGSSHGNRMEGLGLRPQPCTCFTCPSSNKVLPRWAAFSSLPNSEWEPLFQEMPGAQSQGRRLFACCPPPSLVRPPPPRPTPLAAECLLNISVTSSVAWAGN